MTKSVGHLGVARTLCPNRPLALTVSLLLSGLAQAASSADEMTVSIQVRFDWFWAGSSCPDAEDVQTWISELHGSGGSRIVTSECTGSDLWVSEWDTNSVLVTGNQEALMSVARDCFYADGTHQSCQVVGAIMRTWTLPLQSTRPFFPPITAAGGFFVSQGVTQWGFDWDQGPQFGECHFTPCREDFDASGEINFADLSLILLAWGEEYSAGAGAVRIDLDDSGRIDGGDLALLLLSAGTCIW